MVAQSNRDFASVLDELLAADPPPEAPSRPSIPYDYLAVADELHSGRIHVSAEAEAEYAETGASLEAELAALLMEAEVVPAAPEPLPPIEPEAIAVELGLGTASPDDLGRLRRAFALKNHPDRVAPHLRQRALMRMQVANGLIDDARRRALARAQSTA